MQLNKTTEGTEVFLTFEPLAKVCFPSLDGRGLRGG